MIPENLQQYQLDPKIFDQAMTHRSYLNENPGSESNERLEFLGDAILEYLISEALYNTYTDQPEGILTAMRSQLVQTQSLAQVARQIDLGPHLKLAKGEEQAGGRENLSLLENAFEALIGALYLSSGIDTTREFLKQHLFPQISALSLDKLKDPKSEFQEKIQAQGMSTPHYKVLTESGPDHDKEFTVAVFVDEQEWGRGTGKSKQTAQQSAASDGLQRLTSSTTT